MSGHVQLAFSLVSAKWRGSATNTNKRYTDSNHVWANFVARLVRVSRRRQRTILAAGTHTHTNMQTLVAPILAQMKWIQRANRHGSATLTADSCRPCRFLQARASVYLANLGLPHSPPLSPDSRLAQPTIVRERAVVCRPALAMPASSCIVFGLLNCLDDNGATHERPHRTRAPLQPVAVGSSQGQDCSGERAAT